MPAATDSESARGALSSPDWASGGVTQKYPEAPEGSRMGGEGRGRGGRKKKKGGKEGREEKRTLPLSGLGVGIVDLGTASLHIRA